MSERRREREVLKYYRCWLDALEYKSRSEETDHVSTSRNDGSVTIPSRDKSLLSFAQLTCLRLGVCRALISLNTSSHELILAEAGPTTSLIPPDVYDHNLDYEAYDEFWISEAKLSNSEGLSQHALHPPMYTTHWRDGRSYSIPALVMQDISNYQGFINSVYSARPIKFFAAVPIVSRQGYHLGTLQAFDDAPRNKLSADEMRFMQEMSTTVLGHLDQSRNNAARARGENMLQGLSQFVQGHASAGSIPSESQADRRIIPNIPILHTTTGRPSSDTGAAQVKLAQRPRITTARSENSEQEPDRSSTLKAHAESGSQQRENLSEVPNEQNATSNLPNKDLHTSSASAEHEGFTSDRIHAAFNRAADILREAAAVDGVVFYDATSSKSSHDRYSKSSAKVSGDISEPGSGMSGSSSNSSRRTSLDSLSEKDIGTLRNHTSMKPCHILGLSHNSPNVIRERGGTENTLRLSQRDLRRMITRYPRGKVFYYTDLGDVSPSGGDTTNSESTHSLPERLASRSTETNPRAKAIADALLRAVPGAKIALFFPLFDYHEGQWGTGCFMWSDHTESLLAARDVLSYIEAFGHSVNAETGRLKALAAEEAKTTFIANISHELRSPLHGILGSLEFLRESMDDPFQEAMVTTLETCSKTLLDTVDHVLDYAKINSLSQRSRTQQLISKNEGDAATQDAITRNFDIAVSIEEVVEAVYAGQTFRTANSLRHGPNITGNDSTTSQDEDGRPRRNRTDTKYSGRVRLSLDIAPRDSWTVRSQPGAVTRIVMNLLGNALKYTDKGSILVTLREERDLSNDDDSVLALYLSVKDTGRGMSAEFLEKHAFTAFTQEDSFMSGTGLGLTIVHQLVKSLNGKIEVRSKKGMGTEVIVRLGLPKAELQSSASHDLLAEIKQVSSGLTLCILNQNYEFDEPSLLGRRVLSDPVEDCVHSLAQNWFGMRVVRTKSINSVEADIFVYAEPPPIEYLKEHHGDHIGKISVPLILMTPNAYETALVKSKGIHKDAGLGDIIEVISQPCGPLKLARCLHRCFQQGRHPAETSNNMPHSVTTNLNDDPETPPGTPQLLTERSGHTSTRGDMQADVGPASNTYDDSFGNSGASSLEFASERRRTSKGYEQKDSTTLPQLSKSNDVPELVGGKSSETHSESSRSSSSTVLLVDDNEINLKLLVTCAKRAKVSYISAMDGLEALHTYQRVSSDPATSIKLICMDLSMPVMDGMTAARHIRTFEKTQGLKAAKIIAVTGNASESIQREAAQIGFDAFLTKPVAFKELARLLKME